MIDEIETDFEPGPPAKYTKAGADALEAELLELKRATGGLIQWARTFEDGPLADIVDAEEALDCTPERALELYRMQVEYDAERERAPFFAKLDRLEAENAKLRAALQPFARRYARILQGEELTFQPLDQFAAAHEALKGGGK